MFGLPVRPGDSEVNRVGELPAVTRADGLLFKRMGGAVFPASACRRSAENCPAGRDALGRPDPVLLGVHPDTVGDLSFPAHHTGPHPRQRSEDHSRLGPCIYISRSRRCCRYTSGRWIPVSCHKNLPPSICCLPADLVPQNLGGADDFPVQDHIATGDRAGQAMAPPGLGIVYIVGRHQRPKLVCLSAYPVVVDGGDSVLDSPGCLPCWLESRNDMGGPSLPFNSPRISKAPVGFVLLSRRNIR